MNRLFSRNVDIYKNADINWRMNTEDNVENYIVLAEGYRDSTIQLLQDLLTDNAGHRADSIIFPIMFCTYQYVELVLKAILILNGRLNGKANHNIKQYLADVEQLLVDDGNLQQEVSNHLSVISTYIDDIYGNISYTDLKGKQSMAFEFARFPTGNDGLTPLFYVKGNDELISIDLENYLSMVKNMADVLDGLFQMYINREGAN